MPDQSPVRPTKKIARIEVDRDLCIGAASCIALAPGAFELDSEGKAIVTDMSSETAEALMAAAESCPTKAIRVYDEEGNQLYP
ncbi:MAG: ferredoxin [bacterium]|nr:ferredoxin [bacterium]